MDLCYQWSQWWRNYTTEVDKLDIDKLVPVPADLSKLGDAVKTDIVKKNCAQ